MAAPHKLPRTAWKPGQSGNPKGRPALGFSMSDAFRKVLEETDESGMTNREKVAAAAVNAALSGDMQAAKLLANYLDGMPQQKIDATTNGKDIAGYVVVPSKSQDDTGDADTEITA